MDIKTRQKIKNQEKSVMKYPEGRCKCGHRVRIYKTMMLHEWRNEKNQICQSGACFCGCKNIVLRKNRQKPIKKLEVPPTINKDPLDDLFVKKEVD